MKKILMLIAPCTNIYSNLVPYQAVPLLAGQLKNKNYQVECRDFSVELISDIRNNELIKHSKSEVTT